MSEQKITHPDEADEYFFDEGCFILEAHNDPADAAVSIARARMQPGMTTDWHWLEGITERYYILQGSGRVEIGQ